MINIIYIFLLLILL